MKKLNKKGFTLIEMLVVIAIIAVLVSIIIPTVTAATDKAKAAADAANLRSALATATVMSLEDNSKNSYTADELGVPSESKYNEDDTFSCTLTRSGTGDIASVDVYYGNHAIEYYASIAAGETADTSHDKTT